MWIAEIAERAILSAMSDIDVTFRASRVDDEEMNPAEHADYPVMVIEADGGNSPGNTYTHYDLPVTVTLVTLRSGDAKRVVLAALESSFRKVIDQGITTEFNAVSVAAGESWYLQGIVDIVGNKVEYETPTDSQTKVEQKIVTTMLFKICGSFPA